jgi:transcription termination/antitermination protein NusG
MLQGSGSGEAVGSLPDASFGQWFVLHTRSRQEKALAEDLAAAKIAYYLPLVRRVRVHGLRKAVVDLPLFPGYVFLRGMLEQAFVADRTKRVARIIKVADQEQLDWELRNLHLAITHEVSFETYSSLKRGVRVEVRAGPLMGLQGIVEERKRDRLYVQVQMLGSGVSLEIDEALLDSVA